MAASTSDAASDHDPRTEPNGYGPGRIISQLADFAGNIIYDVFSILSSRKVQKGVLSTVLIVTASSVLYILAVLAYLLFYRNYLPDQITTVPVHLQYGFNPANSYGVNPWGVASLTHTNLKNLQPYDISVTLTLPKSPANLDRGNFMVALHLLDDLPPDNNKIQKPQSSQDPISPPPTPYTTTPSGHPLIPIHNNPTFHLTNKRVLYTSTRPALLPYTDPLVSHAKRILFLAWYVVFPDHSERTTLRVSLAEALSFPRRGADGGSATLPTSVFVEVQAGQTLQVYEASARFAAQLGGLRWVMYMGWGVPAFVVFTGGFWVAEVVGMVVTWLVAAVVFGWVVGGGAVGEGGEEEDGEGDGVVVKVEGGGEEGKGKVREHDDGLSDTERTFPSTSRQPPLKFEGRIKQEEGEAEGVPPDVHPAVEADDEDEGEGDEDVPGYRDRDSGIGTSYDDNVSREGVKRRTSRHG